MAAVGVVTAIANPALEAVVVGALAERRDDVQVVRRCVEVADVLAVAASGVARVVAIGERLSGLDADIVSTIASYGVAPVAISEPGAHWPRACRIPIELDIGLPADELADAICAAARSTPDRAAALAAAAAYRCGICGPGFDEPRVLDALKRAPRSATPYASSWGRPMHRRMASSNSPMERALIITTGRRHGSLARVDFLVPPQCGDLPASVNEFSLEGESLQPVPAHARPSCPGHPLVATDVA